MLAGLGPRQTLARHPQRWSGAARAQLRVARGGPPLRLHAPEASRSRARVGVSVGVSVSVGVGVGVGVRAGVRGWGWRCPRGGSLGALRLV